MVAAGAPTISTSTAAMVTICLLTPGNSADSRQHRGIRVLTNTFDAEYGRNSGAVINVVTKSGTNSLHGNVYEFLRNQLFNAKGFLDLRRPMTNKTSLRHVGRTIKKDRTFFFASYEGRRVVHGISSIPSWFNCG